MGLLIHSFSTLLLECVDLHVCLCYLSATKLLQFLFWPTLLPPTL